MGCAVSLPSVREDNDCAIRYSDKHTLETPDPKSQLTGSAEVTDLATKTLQTPESENFGNSLSESYKIRAEGASCPIFCMLKAHLIGSRMDETL